MTTFTVFQQQKVVQIETALDNILPMETVDPTYLHRAMRYSTLNGGKRIRAMLVYATGNLLQQPSSLLDDIACSVELIHAYSLIHDDLPAMDDDDLRRGKPSCHKAFDEATAILAGDALLTLAFKTLSSMNASPEQALHSIQLLSEASGSSGMVGGQAIDLANEGEQISIHDIENMHSHKTGALITACITMVSSLVFNPNDSAFQNLKSYAQNIGLAFQIQDDILDETSTTEMLGKTQGKDAQAAKSTYPSLIGLEASIELAEELYQRAISNLSQFDDRANFLRDIAKFTVSRQA